MMYMEYSNSKEIHYHVQEFGWGRFLSVNHVADLSIRKKVPPQKGLSCQIWTPPKVGHPEAKLQPNWFPSKCTAAVLGPGELIWQGNFYTMTGLFQLQCGYSLCSYHKSLYNFSQHSRLNILGTNRTRRTL